jgi:hypothetical protein
MVIDQLGAQGHDHGFPKADAAFVVWNYSCVLLAGYLAKTSKLREVINNVWKLKNFQILGHGGPKLLS